MEDVLEIKRDNPYVRVPDCVSGVVASAAPTRLAGVQGGSAGPASVGVGAAATFRAESPAARVGPSPDGVDTRGRPQVFGLASPVSHRGLSGVSENSDRLESCYDGAMGVALARAGKKMDHSRRAASPLPASAHQSGRPPVPATLQFGRQGKYTRSEGGMLSNLKI